MDNAQSGKEEKTMTHNEKTTMAEYGTMTDKAADLFMRGYNCGQAVLLPFASRYGINQEQAARLAAAFGGGIGRQRMTCGTVLSLTLLAGLEEGNAKPDEKEAQQNCFKVVQRMTEEFKAQYGSVVCGEILGLKGFVKALGPAINTPLPECYKIRPCALKVRLAAAIFERFLREKEKSK